MYLIYDINIAKYFVIFIKYVIFYVAISIFFCILWRKNQFHIFLSILSYLRYFLIQIVFSEPNLHVRIFIFTRAYSWNHGSPVTCVNEGNSKFWLQDRKEKPLISLVTSFYHDRMKITISPRLFYNVWYLLLLKKIFLQYLPGSSANFVITDIIF